jgi:hypothetical protein
VINADPNGFPIASLMVVEDQLHYWDGAAAQRLRDLDYILLRFEGFGHRDDLRAFSDLATLRKAALDAFIKDGDEAGDTAYAPRSRHRIASS